MPSLAGPEAALVSSEPVVRLSHVSKRFGAVTALSDVSLKVARGRVLEAPLRVGTSADPYAVILDHVVPLAHAQGLDIKMFQFTDYTIPNEGKDSRFAFVSTTRKKDKRDPRVASLIAIHRSLGVNQFILDRVGGTIIPTW